MTSIATFDPLTPSEVVLLNGEAFVPTSRFTSVKLPHKDVKVIIDRLLITMLAAAVLANEQVGVLTLKAGRYKLLGRSRDTLYVYLADPAADWPDHTLEAAMRDQARLLLADKGREAYALVHGWLAGRSTNWHGVFYRVRGNLMRRELLQEVKVRRFKVLPSTEYELAPQAVELVAHHPLEPTRQLLSDCERQRPQVWKLLWDHIKYGFVRRRAGLGT
jgi:hypothetical protein